MTTIAYKDGVMAGDQRLSSTDTGHIWTDKCRKVFKLRDGSIFGGAGDDDATIQLLAALKKGFLAPKIEGDVDAIHVTPDGKVFLWSGTRWCKWHSPFAAIGSGKRNAITALRLGHDAVTAVKEGIANDVFSGGRVQTVKLKRKAK